MNQRVLFFALLTVLAGTVGAQVPASQHVVVIVEENHDYSQVIGSSAMPYLNSLANQYGSATQYYANTHPSIGNYFMMTVGQIITNNDNYTGTVTADNLVRHLLSAGKTWKSYAEGLPSVGYVGGDTGLYVRHHNPFTYLSDVYTSQVQKQNLVPFTHFAADLNNNALPDISFIIPNLIDDAHDGTLQQADAWLKTNIAPLLTNTAFKQDGILIIVFDESASDNTHGGGRIACLVIGPKVIPGVRSSVFYQHQNLLRTISEAVGLTSFPGAASTAVPMKDFFAQVALSPTSLSFGNQTVGTKSSAKTLTLKNNQSSAITGLSFSATGDFAQSNNCGTSLAANSSCTISVTFTPTTVGARSGTLTVRDSAGTQSATLSGTGVGNVSLAPSSVNFGNQPIGTASSPRTVTLTNGQGTSLTSIKVSIAGANASDFAQTNNCGTSLAANSHCSINVTFNPTGNGSRNATLTVTDSAGTQTSSVTGTGVSSTVGQLIQNGGFEAGNLSSWIASGVYHPFVTSVRRHAGAYSAQLGASATPEPNGNSSFYQTVTIPSTSVGASLNFYYWAASTDTIANDWQEVQIQNNSGVMLAQVMKACSNIQAWTHVYFNLLPYKGQTLRIYFNTHQNGNNKLTYMNVDDITVSVK